MGIKGLQSYINKEWPKTKQYINFEKEAIIYQKRERRKPVLVVDGLATLRKLYGNLEWALGGQWVEYLEELDWFVHSFNRIGVELVFMFDGSVGQTKRPVWVQRRKRNRNDLKKVLDYIKRYGEHPPPNLFMMPPCLGQFCRMFLKYDIGAKVYNTEGEADREIFEYCQNNGCWGVLTQDSDFFIFECGKFFSIEELNLDKMTTYMYDRETFCLATGLDPLHLPLFASCIGTDILDQDHLDEFHRRIKVEYCTKTSRYQRTIVHEVLLFIQHALSVPKGYKGKSSWRRGGRKAFIDKYVDSVYKIADEIFWSSNRLKQLFIDSVKSFLPNNVLKDFAELELPTKFSETVHMRGSEHECVPGNDLELVKDPHKISHVQNEEQKSCTRSASSAEETRQNLDTGPSSIRISPPETSNSEAAVTTDNGYSPPCINPSVKKLAMLRHLNCENLAFIHQVVSGVDVDSGVVLEDSKDPELQPCSLLYNPIKQRILGLLLGVGTAQEDKNQEDVKSNIDENPNKDLPIHPGCENTGKPLVVNPNKDLPIHPGCENTGKPLVVNKNAILKWSAYAGNPLTHAELLEALPVNLPGGTPLLYDLWTENGDANELKWMALAECMRCKLPIAELKMLEGYYIPVVCILHFLIQQDPGVVIHPWEINAFLATATSDAICCARELRKLPNIRRVDSRGANMATVFVRGVIVFMNAVAVCGYPLAMKSTMIWKYFDGRLFHTMFLQAKEGFPLEKLCQTSPQREKALKLRQMIISETRMRYAFKAEN